MITGAYDDVMDGNLETTTLGKNREEGDTEKSGGDSEGGGGKEFGKRIRIASGKHWDVILHALPKGA